MQKDYKQKTKFLGRHKTTTMRHKMMQKHHKETKKNYKETQKACKEMHIAATNRCKKTVRVSCFSVGMGGGVTHLRPRALCVTFHPCVLLMARLYSSK